MLVLVNGEYVVLEKVQHEILESPIAVYNFQVEDDHTYYVGESGLLVHNACNGNVKAAQRGTKIHKAWDYGQNGTTFVKEYNIPGVGRADAVDFAKRIVYELKPNNSRAIRQGWRQLNRYAQALEKDGGAWMKVLVTYGK